MSELSRQVPELWDSDETLYEDLPHDVFGTLAQVLCEWIAGDEKPDALCRAVDFMNRMAESDSRVANVLEISVFAVMCDHDRCCEWLRNQELSDAARRLLQHAIDPLGEKG